MYDRQQNVFVRPFCPQREVQVFHIKMIRTWSALPLVAAGLFVSQQLTAQHYNNLWARTTFVYTPIPSMRLDAELQHRRQNVWEKENIMGQNLLFSFRQWIHYQYNKDVRFSLSPFALFSNYKVTSPSEINTAPPLKEIRVAAATDVQHSLSHRFHLSDRTGLEYRMFQNGQKNIVRLRIRPGLRYDLGHRTRLMVYDEILLNMNNSHHFFDQNRMGMSAEYSFSPHLRLEAGYLHIVRLPLSSEHLLRENNLVVNLTCLL